MPMQRCEARRTKRYLAAAALVATAGLAGCGDKNTYVAPPPPQVTVAPVVQGAATNYFNLTGNTTAINTVDLEARVQGFLETINYKDGAFAAKGTLLFGIERDQYQAQLDLQKADLQAAQAKQANAQVEYGRQVQLGRQDFASQRAVDDAKTNLDQATAQVAADKANVELATINLGYTQVTAPFDGIVTRHLVDVGALVGYAGPTKLATIVQLDPIYVYFNVSETQVLQVKQALAKQGKTLSAVETNAIPVEVGLQTEEGYSHKGRIDYVAPQVDASTGTLTVRAIFDNKDRALLPGLFVRVRVPVQQLDNAMLVPDVAIGTGQVGSYLLTVGKDNVVQQRPVKLGQVQDGGMRVVLSGINPDDLVIIDGTQRAVPGNKVAPVKAAPEQVSAIATGATTADKP